MDQPDPAAELARAAQRQVAQLIAELPSPERLGLEDLLASLAAHPERVAEIHRRYYREYLELWTRTTEPQSAPGGSAAADRRFAAPEWDRLPFFRLLKDSYLLNARWLRELVDAAQLPGPTHRRLAFALGQYLDALAPTNFPATNPEVLRLAAQSGGASLAAGLHNLEVDALRGRMQMSDEGAFAVGRDLAITPGAVVYQNAVVQLIQYSPRTPSVHARPLLIVPPFINKYYILDLRPENSFVRFALEQGQQVFIVSWRNAGVELERATWDDYAREGVLAPLEAVLDIAASARLNVLGFCVGGTLLASTLAVMPRPARIASLTLLATMLDFSDVGEIGVYIDEEYVARCEQQYRDGGLVSGRQLAHAFATLRANELIWRFHVDNYLKGTTPVAFDLLFWNADSSNLPGRLYAWYLRNMYLENNLRTRHRLSVLERPVDLGRIRAPAYVVATREDHIVPWTSAYAAHRLLGGRMEFVLGASGHVAGVVNPPDSGRRCFWHEGPSQGGAGDWLAAARREPGSWWPHWSAWVRQHAGRRIRAPQGLGSERYPPIEAAPGRYVLENGKGLGSRD
jgi:poly[(R)-3-hydroxyalkanoate] polymerase subunit PhaC